MNEPSVLFLDQTGALGGGELALRDVVRPYRARCRVVLFTDGPLRGLLEEDGVPVTSLGPGPGVADGSGGSGAGRGLASIRRESGPIRALAAAPAYLRLVRGVAAMAREHDLVYANSQKAMLVGAAAARLAGVPLVSHLHDILSPAHFSTLNRRLSVMTANRFCRRIIADSTATAEAFVAAGGRADKVEVVYYGFESPPPPASGQRASTRAELGVGPDDFVVGHIGRLSPWKGQDILIRALARVPHAVGVIVGEALFGEDELARTLPELGASLGLADRLRFTGFRADVVDVMRACDVVVHSSTSPEPFGRVIVEAMLAGVPVVAARAGGPCEIIDDGRTGWLTEPGDEAALAERISALADDPSTRSAVASRGAAEAAERFTMEAMHAGIARVIESATSANVATETEGPAT